MAKAKKKTMRVSKSQGTLLIHGEDATFVTGDLKALLRSNHNFLMRAEQRIIRSLITAYGPKRGRIMARRIFKELTDKLRLEVAKLEEMYSELSST